MSRPLRALVVDDNAVNLELARFVLESGGFEVDTAQNAAALWASIDRCMPDVVLMDIQMPGTDGLELTRQFRSDSRTGNVMIVAFTAYAMRGDEKRFRAAGCDGYLSKPIDVATFADQVRALVTARS